MKKNRILFILHLPPPVHGSSVVGQCIKNSGIINQEFDCHFINLGTSRSLDEIGKNAGKKVFKYLSILSKVFGSLITHRPDICYVSIAAKGKPFYKDALVVSLVKIFQIKLIYHFHNKGIREKQYRFFDNLLYRFIFNNSDGILLSKYLFYDVQSYFPENRIQICPNGMPKLSTQRERKEENQQGIIKILFLSNLFESKGVNVLLEACSLLKQAKIPFECAFIGGEGDISESQFLLRSKSLDLSKNIKYLGAKYGDEKRKAFEDADIFAFPTFNDCLPLVILEAMQYELPVISTFEGSIPDVVEDNVTGFLVRQKDAKALSEKLVVLIQSEELRIKMGKLGRLKYEREFTLEKFENRITEILKLMANNH